MLPLELELHNCLSFREAFLDFRPLRGLVLLTGENRDSACQNGNGSGKSALVAALYWILYGKLPCLRYRADEVVYRRAGADCMGRLRFLDAEGRTIEVVRHRQHATRGDAVVLTIDGREIRGAAKDTQPRIDAIVGADAATFLGACLYTQHPLRGRFLDLPDADRKALLDSVLGVEVLSAARELVKRDLRSRTADLARADAELQRIGDRSAWLDDAERAHRAQAATWEERRAARIAALDRDLAALRHAQAAMAPVRPSAGSTAETEEALARAQHDRDHRAACVQAADREAHGQEAATRQEIGRHAALAERIQADLRALAALGGTCPVCRQPIDPIHAEAHRVDLEATLTGYAGAEAQARARLRNLEAQRARVRAAWEGERRTLDQAVSEARTALEAARAAIAARAAADREWALREEQITRLANGRAAVEAEPNSACDLLARAEAERVEITAARTVAETRAAELRGMTATLEFWDKGLGPRGLIAYLLDAVLPQLNERAAHYSAMLTGGEIAVSLSLVTEPGDKQDALHIEVAHRSGITNPWLLSGGERQRLNLILSLALQDLVARRARRAVRLAVYDEAFESLDTVGVETVVRVLHEAARHRDLVLVVTHQPALQDLFAQEIRVVYEHGESRLEVRG